MPPSFVLGRSSPAPREDSPVRAISLSVLDRAKAIMEFADRSPRLAFEAGLEPIALEMRLAVSSGALVRLAGDGTNGLGAMARQDLEVLDRASRLQGEALRRLSSYEAAIQESASPTLGKVVETFLSIASGVGSLAMVFA